MVLVKNPVQKVYNEILIFGTLIWSVVLAEVKAYLP